MQYQSLDITARCTWVMADALQRQMVQKTKISIRYQNEDFSCVGWGALWAPHTVLRCCQPPSATTPARSCATSKLSIVCDTENRSLKLREALERHLRSLSVDKCSEARQANVQRPDQPLLMSSFVWLLFDHCTVCKLEALLPHSSPASTCFAPRLTNVWHPW